MITSFHAENFRGFEKLDLEGFKRCNLIVGRNNSGKTSLLEGIHLLTDSSTHKLDALRTSEGINGFQGLETLVRRAFGVSGLSMRIGREDSAISALRSSSDEAPESSLRASGYKLVAKAGKLQLFSIEEMGRIRVRTISSGTVDPGTLVKPYSAVVSLKDGEERLQKLLNAVDSRVRKIRLVVDGNRTILKIDIGLEEMLPISLAGEGLKRLMWIFTDMISFKPDLLIIDEIENGIHHSQLGTVWKGIAEAAAEFNVQVFATTHSYECITAANEVFSAREEYDFSLIQLFRTERECSGRVLDQETIQVAIDSDIELR